jgi:hypothetical protein
VANAFWRLIGIRNDRPEASFVGPGPLARTKPILDRDGGRGEERDRLWARWRELSDDYDAWAARRSGPAAVVVLEPRPDEIGG